jgi:hypothetical protein
VLTGTNSLTVDPIFGNDATGGFNGTPIQTIARLNSIMCGVFISAGTLRVLITSSPPISDAELDLTVNYQNSIQNLVDFAAGAGSIVFTLIGATIFAHAGQLSTVTPAAYVAPPGAPIRGQVTDVGVATWAPFAFQRIVITSGPRGPFQTGGQVGGPASAWLYPTPASLPATTGTISAPVDISVFPWGFLAGDNYAILSQVQLKLRQFTVIGDETGAARLINLNFIKWTTAVPGRLSNFAVFNCFSNVDVDQCRIDQTVTNTTLTRLGLNNCCLRQGYSSGGFVIIAGILTPNSNYSQDLTINNLVITGDGALGIGNFLNTDSAGSITTFLQTPNPRHPGFFDAGIQFWDWTASQPGLQISTGINFICAAPMYGNTASANTCGLELTSGGQLSLINEPSASIATPVPNITGTGHYIPGSDGSDTDFVIDDLLNGAGTPIARAWQEGPGTFTPQIPCKWTNYTTAQPAGFGATGGDPTSQSNAQSVATGSRIATSRLGT